MLKIGKSYIIRVNGTSRLCADLTVGDRRTTLWFGVDSAQEGWLSLGRADAFVMALLPGAMRGGHEIVCEDPMSERLHCQLTGGLIPTLAFAGELYHVIKITAPLTAEKMPNQGVVGTGFSGGADCLYTIMRHGPDCEFPLTHIAVFNNGFFEDEACKISFQKSCRQAVGFGGEQRLETVFLDTNLCEVLPERTLDVYSFRNLACVLALQGLFSVYLLSSGHDAANFTLDLRNSASYDLMNTRYASTEALTFYHSGEEAKRWEKLAALADWEPSWRWLHPCFKTGLGAVNCGHCKKCVRDMATFFALGCLERYQAVYDIEDFLRNLPQRMGVLLAHSNGHLYQETVQLLKERNVPIPQIAYVYEKQFRRAMRRLGTGAEGEGTPC